MKGVSDRDTILIKLKGNFTPKFTNEINIEAMTSMKVLQVYLLN